MTQKKYLPVLIFLSLAVLVAASFGIGALNEHREQTEAEEEMLYASWDQYLSYLDELDSIQLWTLRYINDYLDAPDWDRLLKARAAVAAGMAAAKKIEPPDITIRRETKELLHRQREELEAMSSIFEQAVLMLDSVMIFLEEMSYNLEEFFLYKADHQQMKQYVANHEEMLRCDESYTAVFTNQLFLVWGMEERWNPMLESHPSFATFCDAWEDNRKLLEKKAEALLDKFNQLAVKFSNFIELEELTLQNFKSGNAANPKETISFPSGTPRFTDGSLAVFPMPSWLQAPASTYYAVPAGEGKTQLVKYGADLMQKPIMTCYYYDYVTREEYESYYQDLKMLGFLVTENYEDDSSIFIASKDEYRLTVQWSSSETVLRLGSPMPVLLAPTDYILCAY